MTGFRTALIAAVVSAFVAAGAAVATTQAFVLGTGNRVDAPTKVTNLRSDGTANPVDGALLSLENQSTTANATPLSLVAAANHAPFKVNTGVTVTNLDADLLDGFDSTAFTQGGGRVDGAHLDSVAQDARGTLMTVPGLTVAYHCGSTPFINLTLDHLNVVLDNNGAIGFHGPNLTGFGAGSPGVTSLHVLASRPHRIVPFQTAVLDDLWLTGAWNSQTSTCVFQAVGESL